MMDETQSVITAGAGAVTRLIGSQGEIERIYAHKLPLEYLKDCARIELQQRKVVQFYENGCSNQKSAY